VRKLCRGLVLSICLAVGLSGAPSLAAADAGSPWAPGPDAVGVDTYTGFIDAPASGVTITRNSKVVVRGWIVDQTAVGWTGIDAVQVFLGLQDQGGTLLASATVGQRRDDVAAALGNPFWVNSGFSAAFTDGGLGVGSNLLTIYVHTPDKGWWYRQIEVRVQPLPDIGFADDPLMVINEVVPSLDVDHKAPTLTIRGWAIDRNLPLNVTLGVGGSGVNSIQVYLDGPRNDGTFLVSAQLGRKNREATGFGQRFLQSGWELTVHPGDLSVDKHDLFMYVASAYWPNETLYIVPFNVH
jgi:hypothetical protein